MELLEERGRDLEGTSFADGLNKIWVFRSQNYNPQLLNFIEKNKVKYFFCKKKTHIFRFFGVVII